MSRLTLVATLLVAPSALADSLPSTIAIDSGVVVRTLAVRDSRIRTAAISNRVVGRSLAVAPESREFSLTLEDGTACTSAGSGRRSTKPARSYRAASSPTGTLTMD